MTVSELRKILKGLPAEMPVCVIDNETLYSACNGTTGITPLEIEGRVQNSLIITACKCNEEPDFTLN